MSKTLSSLILLVFLCVGSVHAQSPVLAQMYGRGVHLYYSGQLLEAYDVLTSVINAGTEDPRAYYFRGLAASASGRSDEAITDWRAGAELEAKSPLAGLVGQSLRRIQGSTRMELEKVRQEVRMTMRGDEVARARTRFQEMKQVEAEVLRGGAASPAATAAAPAVVPSAAPAAANPFGGADTPLANGAPRVEAADALKDPFADDAAAAAAAPAADTGAMEPAGAADPFGSPAAPAADPFGSPAPAATPGAADAPMADPFGANPFGT